MAAYITEQQRHEARLQKKNDALADGIACYKRRHHLTNEELAAGLRMGSKQVRAILEGRPGILTAEQWWLSLAAAGLLIKRRETNLGDEA